MALEERRTLKEVAILVDRGHINCMWADEIVKDGAVLMSTEHRGAYPTNESGEPDDAVVGLLGASLSSLLGEVANQSLSDLAGLQQIHRDLESDFNTKLSQLADKERELSQAQAEIQFLSEQNQQLNSQLVQAGQQIEMLTVQLANSVSVVGTASE